MWQLVLWDLRMLSRDGTVIAVLVTLLALGGLAGMTGLSALADHARSIEAAREAATGEIEALGPDGEITPLAVRAATLLAPGPLAEIAVGRSRLDPVMGVGGLISATDRLFEGYQIASPDVLAWARFDLAALITLVLPLAIIALGVGIVADERTAGRLGMIDAAGSLPRVLVSRILSRAGLLLVPLFLVIAGTLVLGGQLAERGDRSSEIFALVGLVLAQCALWWLIVAAVGLRRMNAGSAAAWLIGVWAVLAVILPSAVASIAQLSSAAPDRLDFTAERRAAELTAVQEAGSLAAAYLNDHPDMEPTSDTPQWARDRFVVARAVDEAIAPRLVAFDRALEEQAARARQLALLSPISALTIALSDLAGTGAERQLAFRAAARERHLAFREEMGRALMLAAPIDRERARAMRFALLGDVAPAASSGDSALTLASILLWLIAAGAAVVAIARTSRPLRLASG